MGEQNRVVWSMGLNINGKLLKTRTRKANDLLYLRNKETVSEGKTVGEPNHVDLVMHYHESVVEYVLDQSSQDPSPLHS